MKMYKFIEFASLQEVVFLILKLDVLFQMILVNVANSI